MVFDEPKIVSEKEQEQSYAAFVNMENLLDKLKLLKYEQEFLKDFKIKPIHRYYFVVTKNPGEQFYLFSILAAWLIRKCGKHLENPQELDDPNDTISKIVNEARAIGIVFDFPVSKLKQGVGEQVVYILDQLAIHAVKKNNVILNRPKPPEEKEEETEVLEDESEINLDRVEEEMLAAYSDDSDEENLFHLDDLKPVRKEIHSSELKQNIDEESWKLELERVLPRLKVTIKNDNRDWRSHLEQMKTYKKSIDESLGTTKAQLEKLHKDISSTLEKVTNREKYFNSSFGQHQEGSCKS
ncbi:unnamed protein product [Acanthoscelides obtectus]|uniref:Intraflagellar transport protein 57 homolog n=1 Tax=Acanthoscelides obtectus TaxID=200917 RepID=A0A9P0JU27_ACAOB|nr:unnamed protein product [Acanthoscelides obtectus]CAK1679418.1 Intraflagellar transport protein 57 homolog [Acanthoscelides obtectus]